MGKLHLLVVHGHRSSSWRTWQLFQLTASCARRLTRRAPLQFQFTSQSTCDDKQNISIPLRLSRGNTLAAASYMFVFFWQMCFSKNICLFPTTKKSSLVHQQWAKLRFNKHIFLFPTTKKKLADSPKTNKMFCFQPQKKNSLVHQKTKKKTLNTTYLFVSNHKIKVRWCIKKKKKKVKTTILFCFQPQTKIRWCINKNKKKTLKTNLCF